MPLHKRNFLLLFALLLTGCLGAGSASEPPAFLSGKSLEECGYRLALEGLLLDGMEVERFLSTQTVSEENNITGELRGSYTNVFVNFTYQYGTTPLFSMMLQGYPAGEPKTVRVGLETLSDEEASAWLVYQDDTILVYDWYPLLYPEADAASLLRKTIEDYNRIREDTENWPPDRIVPDPIDAGDYAFLIEMEQLVRDQMKDLILPIG